MIQSQQPPLPPLHPLPDYWIALLHSRLFDRGVLHIQTPDPELRVDAHCSKLHVTQEQHWRDRSGVDMGTSSIAGAGDVAIAFLNIGQANLTLSFSDGWPQAQAKSWTAWVLSSGQRIANAPNPLQVSRGTVEWSVACAWHERATTPLRGQEGTEAALIVPPTSYGFVVLHGVEASACMR